MVQVVTQEAGERVCVEAGRECTSRKRLLGDGKDLADCQAVQRTACAVQLQSSDSWMGSEGAGGAQIDVDLQRGHLAAEVARAGVVAAVKGVFGNAGGWVLYGRGNGPVPP